MVAAVARSEGHVPGHGPRSRHAKAARNTPPQRDDGSGHARPVSPGALLHARTRRQILQAGAMQSTIRTPLDEPLGLRGAQQGRDARA